MSSREAQVLAITNLVRTGRLDAAAKECAALTLVAPSDPDTWSLAADIAARQGALEDATRLIHRALECAPGNASLLIRLGHYLLSNGRRTDALRVARDAARNTLEAPEQLDALGTLLSHCGDAERALLLFERAVAAAPTRAAYRYNLAMALRMAGNLEAAESNLDIVLAERPLDGEAQNARSGLRKQTPARNHVAELESVLRQLHGRPGTAGVEFALAKELEDLQEHGRSFAHLSAGCRRVRSSFRYDVSGDVAVLDALRERHSADRLSCRASSLKDAGPIFIVGLPRSGTTLVEQILGSHSEVFAGGEMDVFSLATIRAVRQQCGNAVGKLEFVERALEIDFQVLGSAYLEEVHERTGGARQFTDKLPFNYLYAGLIHAALPGAKFIALRRHPLDVCYAMYKTLFATAYPFTYDLTEIACYYVAWERLMRHWESVIGDAWLNVRYEDIVVNQARCTRSMLEHCGLRWEDECLNFHANARAVATASAAQVRKPLYTDSVGRWRLYAEELKPLIDHLAASGISCQ